MESKYKEISIELEEAIEDFWKFEVKNDFLNRIFLYNEAELVASLYYHLRNYVAKRELNEIRVFLEVSIFDNRRKKCDMVIMGADNDFPWEKHPFLTIQEGETLFAFEFKFVSEFNDNSRIKEDMEKLLEIQEKKKSSQRLYFGYVGKKHLFRFQQVIKELGIEENKHIKFLLGFTEDRNWKNWDFSVWSIKEILKGEKTKQRIRGHARRSKGNN